MRSALTVILILLALVHLEAQARDTRHMLSLQDALDSPTYKKRLDPAIRLYFGATSHPPASRNLGEYVSNKKTNAFGKSDRKACEWVLLSALLSLQERAVAEGGNAVVNIRSYYKKNEVSSETQYECHAGAVMAGVALIGEVVSLPE